MDIHKNARTTPHSRMLIIERLNSGWTVPEVALALGVTGKTVRKWRDRCAAAGAAGLSDRSSRPHHSPTRLDSQAEDEIEALRRSRMTGPAIARRLRRPVSTIGVVLRRRGLGRLTAVDPRPPIIRYQRDRPGELIHIDIKKLGRIDGIGHRITGDRTGQSNRRSVGRGLGWEYVHVAVDDASRLAYTELLPTERKDSAVAFTARAIDWFAEHRVIVERIMTDNGSAYKSFAFRDLLAERGIKHKRTRPYTPRTNGKAERFIQTNLREWAYAQPFHSSADRAAAMPLWIDTYNRSRPHSALRAISPLSWIATQTAASPTTPPATSDPEPRYVAADGVRPRAATAAGGLGLTPAATTQALLASGGDNLPGDDS
jgi:transposase InsO family protein